MQTAPPQTFIYVLKLKPPFQNPESWDEATQKIATDHWQYFIDLKAKNQLVLAGRTAYPVDDKRIFGIAIIYASTQAIAEQIMHNDPAIVNHLMEAELHPFSIAVPL